MDINKTELLGTVGATREMVVNGTKVKNFSLCTERIIKLRDGNCVVETTWHNVVAWESEKNQIDKIQKQSRVSVKGYNRVNKYTSATGIEKLILEVVAEETKVVEE